MRGQREIWIGIRTPVSGGGRGGGDLRGLGGRGGGGDLCRRRFGRSRSAVGSDGWEFAICKRTKKETKTKMKNPRRDFRILRNLWRENRELPNSQASIPCFFTERGREMMELWEERKDEEFEACGWYLWTRAGEAVVSLKKGMIRVYCDSCVLFWTCQLTRLRELCKSVGLTTTAFQREIILSAGWGSNCWLDVKLLLLVLGFNSIEKSWV